MTAHLAGKPAPDVAHCRRAGCDRPVIGRGLCSVHYGRWHLGLDPLEMPGDVAPAPASMTWFPEHVAS